MPRAKTPKIIIEASILKRILAFLLDLFISALVVSPLLTSMASGIPEDISFEERIRLYGEMEEDLWLTNVMALGIMYLYFVIFEQKFRQTVGKMLFKLEVIPESGELKLWQTAARNAFIFANPILLVDAVYYIFSGRRLSDVVAKTRVVEVAQ